MADETSPIGFNLDAKKDCLASLYYLKEGHNGL
jgi:hypothetical protein